MSKDKSSTCFEKWEQDMNEPESFRDDDKDSLDNYNSEEENEG